MVRPRVTTPATGMPALVGLLFVVFVIAGLLVYEWWSTGQSRREIAQRGLQDYAAYATWSTARAGDLAIGSSLSMLFRGLVSNRVTDTASLPSLNSLAESAREVQDCDCALEIPAEDFFRLDLRNQQVTTARPLERASRNESPSGWAAAKVGSFVPHEKTTSVPDDGRWLIRYLTPTRAANGVGFSV